MIVAIHQPNYLPYLGFVEKISQADTYAILDTAQFVRRGEAYHNRNLIKTTHGLHWLTIPVLHTGKISQRICETAIDNKTNWSEKNWRSILHAYGKAPYFNSYMNFFQRTYSQTWNNLATLNEHIIKNLLKEFKVDIKVVRVSDLDVKGNSTELIVNVCKALGADTYLSGKNGMKYLEISKLEDAGICTLFQDFKHPIYKQQHQHLGFIPNLSCIDMLFNCGENSMKILREANPLEIRSLVR